MTLENKEADQDNIVNREPIISEAEKRRLIHHLGKMFSGRYDIEVLPSGMKGVWACSLDPEVQGAISRYIEGKVDSLDTISDEKFIPDRILYDESAIEEMNLGEIVILLRHEAGHAKFTHFKTMIEGQKKAVEDGKLPTSFWLMFEGIEDPRINNLEGRESYVINKQIRKHQQNALNERLSEMPIEKRPLMFQFAYNSFNYWLNGESIKELEGTEVGEVFDEAKELISQYLRNTDLQERAELQEEIWDITKKLEKKEIENEKQRQVADQMGMFGDGGEGEEKKEQSSDTTEKQGNGESFFERLKKALSGDSQAKSQKGKKKESDKDESKQDRGNLSQLTDDQRKQVSDRIGQMLPDEAKELEERSRLEVDEMQKEALEENFMKSFEIRKNAADEIYIVAPRGIKKKDLQKAVEKFKDTVEKAKQEEEVRKRVEINQLEREQSRVDRYIDIHELQVQMEREGFDEDEEEKYRLYQQLEDSISSVVNGFIRRISRIVPRKKETVYGGQYYSGRKIDKRALPRKVPIDREDFYMRQETKEIGGPNLYIGLLGDNSGSMFGEKQEELRKAMIFFSKVCRDMNIPFMETVFGDRSVVIKEFKEDYDNPNNKVKPRIIDNTDASGGWTNLHEGLEVVTAAMQEESRNRPNSHGLIFVITDGGANEGLVGGELTKYIESKRGRFTFKALGLSSDTEEMEEVRQYLDGYFGEENCAYPDKFDDLPQEAERLLRESLKRLKKFISY